VCVFATVPSLLTALNVTECIDGQGGLYAHTMELLDKSRNVSLSEYKNKVVLLVNVASFWVSTPQYLGLNELKKTYGNRGFEILGVPSSIFRNQEPTGNYSEIMNILRFVRPGNGFVPNFPLFSRVDVAGKDMIPLYAWATSRCPSPAKPFKKRMDLLYEEMSAEDIRWNFEKILFGRKGQPYRRYWHNLPPHEVEEDIKYLLNMKHKGFPDGGMSSSGDRILGLSQPRHWYPPKSRNFWPSGQRFQN